MYGGEVGMPRNKERKLEATTNQKLYRDEDEMKMELMDPQFLPCKAGKEWAGLSYRTGVQETTVTGLIKIPSSGC